MKKLCLILVLIFCASTMSQASTMQINQEAKSFKYSTTVERERPELNDATKLLIARYRQNPTEANKLALKRQIAINYDNVVARKKAKLEELKRTARDQSKIDEMQVIVNEMLRERENRINQSLNRFTDPRLRPGVRESKDGFLPILGVSKNVSIAYSEVTNGEYSRFINATGRKAPKGWVNGVVPQNKINFPVVNVSYYDAVAYCNWLSKNDSTAKYRLPTEIEWEQAAGHMPKDADFNSGENRGLMPANAYSQTLSASGAINMWGNAWEWTSTNRTSTTKAIKGGSFDSPRMSCRTESRTDGRNPQYSYPNVGFRVVREK